MRWWWLLVLVVGLTRGTVAAERGPVVLVHYMPWYLTKPVSGVWGWHWTMNKFDPEKTGQNGRPEAATHDQPLIGLYDSNDPAVLECQVLQMKLAGIDGVIVDWYGRADFRDYAVCHRNTLHLIAQLKRAGMKFAICYEDQSIKHRVEAKQLPESEAVAAGKSELAFVAEEWFRDEAYVRVNGRPLLLVFGPQYFPRREQWQALTGGIEPQPVLLGLPHLVKEAGFDGAYGWPPVTGGVEIPPDVWRKYLVELMDRAKAGETVVPVAFPGFRDIYQEAGLHASYGSIDPRKGATLAESLEIALSSRLPVIQIATWNDYGEGTTVEPTVGNGYRSLEQIQAALKRTRSKEDLRLPARLFALRKGTRGESLKERLDAAAELLRKGKPAEARKVLIVAEQGP